MSKQPVVIFGIGQTAELVTFYFTQDSPFEVVAYTVDDKHLFHESFLYKPVVPFEEVEKLYPPAKYKMFIAVAYAELNFVRARFYLQAKQKGYELVSYVSTKATTWQHAAVGSPSIGDNCFILENNLLQPYCSIGNNVILWSGNHIGHHSVIGDHCFIASHVVVSGNVVVEPYCFIGVNATLRDGIKVGKESIIGAGSLIMQSVDSQTVYVAQRTEVYRKKSFEITL